MDAASVAKLCVVLAVLAAVWVLLDWEKYRDRARRLRRALRPAPDTELHPTNPPIERIAADARRIRAQIQHAPPGVPVARLRGWMEAYDDVLVDACRALGFEQRLGELPVGDQRDLERERVERMLTAVGILLPSSA